jgi:sulfur carrier protein ThiS
MKITLKLFAALTDYLPEQARGDNQMACDVAPQASVAHVLDSCNLPEKLVHLVLVNGHYIAPQQRATHALQEGDVLAVWPPIAGG